MANSDDAAFPNPLLLTSPRKRSQGREEGPHLKVDRTLAKRGGNIVEQKGRCDSCSPLYRNLWIVKAPGHRPGAPVLKGRGNARYAINSVALSTGIDLVANGRIVAGSRNGVRRIASKYKGSHLAKILPKKHAINSVASTGVDLAADGRIVTRLRRIASKMARFKSAIS
ncbi:hypothetical protein CEXT_404001 [Caerostris extrusa]|uniref:Uncharacterized protein n=1 Tax=Caerostris extrusa TaxID=172846 RepID=A0AAV4RKH6_CAEEX|nr:hypothetical protein CEXT_404001 [Caerostris extrusa]